MTTKQFLEVARKITELGIYTNLENGQHGIYFLGIRLFGTPENQYKTIWRKYGTLSNLIIFDTSERVNEKLLNAGITEFTAKPTKRGTMCRLHTLKRQGINGVADF